MNKAMCCLLTVGLLLLAPCGSKAMAGDAVGATVNGDVNCSGQLDLADAIFSLNYLFLGGEEPCPFIEPVGGGPEVEALQAQLAEREAEMAALRAELTQAQVELSRSLGDLIRTQRDLLTAEGRILELEAAAGPCGEEVEELRGSLEACNGELETAGAEIEAARQETVEAQEQTDAALQQADDAQAERDDLADLLDECENPRKEFTAPALQGDAGQRVTALSGKLDLLSALFPTAPEAILEDQQIDTFEMGTISSTPEGQRRILVYETVTRALFSVDLCEGGDCDEAERVMLHYDGAGVEQELLEVNVIEPFPVVSDSVPPIEVNISRGPGQQRDSWTIVYEPRSRSIVGFRAEEGYRPVRDRTWPDDDNFGRGNGLVMSVLLSGAEIRSELGLNSPPPISRLLYLGSGQLLVFFSPEVLPAVHLLELEPYQSETNPDFAGNVVQPTWKLRGSFLLFGADDSPYLDYSDFRELTGEENVDIDGFQPFVNSSDESALLFDGASRQFLRISTLGFEEADELGRSEGQGGLEIQIGSESLDEAVGAEDAELNFTHATSRGNGREILLLERNSNTIFSYDYTLPSDEAGLSRLVESGALADGRIDPGEACDEEAGEEEEEEGEEGEGEEGEPDPEGDPDPVQDPGPLPDPQLWLSGQDALEHRLVFDSARGELLAFNYLTGRVIVIAGSEELGAATGGEELDLTRVLNAGVTEEGTQRIRVWDNASSSLLEMDLESILAELCQ